MHPFSFHPIFDLETDLDHRFGDSNRRKGAKRLTSRQSTKSLSNHSSHHPKDRRFSCANRPYQCECGRRYKFKSTLLSHQKRMNGNENGKENRHQLLDVENSLDFKLSELFSLILTGEEQDGKVNKTRSISRASNDSNQFAPFRCDECSKGFTLRRGLVKHLRLVHTLEKPIECEHCGKFFKHAQSLRQHQKWFSIESPLTSDTYVKEIITESSFEFCQITKTFNYFQIEHSQKWI